MNLKDKLLAMKLTEFSFSAFQRHVASQQEGQTERVYYLTLELDEPIEKVIGSNGLYDPNSEKRIPLVVTDVKVIRVNLDIVAKYEKEFKFDEIDGKLIGTGSYAGDLFLDVARSEEVWLTDEKFSKMSGEFKQKKRNEAFGKYLDRYNAALKAS
jgi:hypothetical protein